MWPFGRKREVESLGRRGERLAGRLLKRKGLKILARGYRCPAGEVDLIVLDRSTRRELGAETLVFVEVKTRTSDRYVDPKSAVNADKQRRIRKVARYYLARRAAEEFNIRYDIVSIVLPEGPGQRPQIKHIVDAF